jgi:hypothetical protein
LTDQKAIEIIISIAFFGSLDELQKDLIIEKRRLRGNQNAIFSEPEDNFQGALESI